MSLIIPISNNSDPNDLRNLMRSIEHQTTSEIEVLIICSPTTILLETIHSSLAVRIVRIEDCGASEARNAGAKLSKGSYLAFLDDDIILDKMWVGLLKDTFEDQSIGAVSGSAQPAFQNLNLDWIPRELLWVVGGCYWDSSELKDVYGAAGMNFCIRREVFFSVGGYNQSLGPINDRPETSKWNRLGAEESELALRILSTGKRVVYNPKMLVTHRLRRSSLMPIALFKRAMHVGQNRAFLSSTFSGQSKNASDFLVIQKLPSRIISIELFHHPLFSWKRTSFSVVVVLGTLLGYVIGAIRFRKIKPNH